MGIINKKYKDRLFCFVFGREENKKWTLDLYNAINNTSYDNIDDVQIFTIENVLYMGMKNDVALIVEDVLSVYEQQSTFNPNMPLRELIYVSKLYSRYIRTNKLNVYSESLIKVPKPKLVVFYNGKKDKEDTVLKLSDAFIDNTSNVDSDISVNVKMININYGKNEELLEKCKILEEYSWFIDRVRLHSSIIEIGEAVNRALNEMPDEFELKSYLLIHKAEVTDMCITEYNEEETLKAIGEEKFAEGKAEGKTEDINRINQMVLDGIIPEDVAKTIIDNL